MTETGKNVQAYHSFNKSYPYCGLDQLLAKKKVKIETVDFALTEP